MQRMKTPRADHAILYNKGSIFVFGGMVAKSGSSHQVVTSNSCEIYSVKDDQWIELPAMGSAR